MQQKLLNTKIRTFFYHNFGVFFMLLCTVYGLAILQDYLFSEFYATRFYLSESMLYNIYWLFFLPFLFGILLFYNKTNLWSIDKIIKYHLFIGISISLLHILVFTSFFILISLMLYNTPHRFLGIFKSAISNQLFITIPVYVFVPFTFYTIVKSQKEKSILNRNSSFISFIDIKQNTTIIKLEMNTIQSIETDRPYSVLRTEDRKFLHSNSLKAFERLLDPTVFLRVHRKAIINKNFVIKLQSRKNGDYDVTLSNGQCVRMSRHYRQNWKKLINHLA